ncbi:MAG: 1,6-anhydro-N-acetylmuramyl-L-alanine amidase AmpD [Mesosutterella sp.]|nr:1,6-anhydro-N-acetylmuramyl-L-alanine amidase AmpD [Mesosutterella sp.]
MREPLLRQPRFEIGPEGWALGALAMPSLHFDLRPDPLDVSLIVVHNITLPPGRFGTGCVQRFFTGRLGLNEDPSFESLRGLRVASHFFIERSGLVIQFLSCAVRGWHAGRSCFEGRPRCNDFSVGIELEGTDFEPFEDIQYESLAAVMEALARRYPIRAAAGHSNIAPGRKTDPGPYFDWSRVMTRALLERGVAFPFAAGAGKAPDAAPARAPLTSAGEGRPS